jgi:ribonuclease HI
MKTGAGTGLLFVSPLGEHMRYAVRLHFPASNNMAEYEALLCGLKIAIELGVKCLDVRGDSQLVIDQVMKNASWHDDKMEAYCKAVRALEDKFYSIELNHVPRRYNEEADELAKIASGRITVPPNVFARDIAQPSVIFEPHPSSHTEPSGAPSNPTGTEPMDENPSNEAYVLSLLKGYGAYGADVMDIEPAPPSRLTGTISMLPGWLEGNSPRTGPRPGASPGWPSPLPSSRRAVQARRLRHLAAVRPHSRGARAPAGHPRGNLWPSRRASYPRRQCFPPRLLLADRGRGSQ